MEQASKNRLIRIPLFFMGISIVFYAISFLYLGYVPKNDQITLFDDRILFNLPYNVSQLWNPLLVFVLVFLIIVVVEIWKKMTGTDEDKNIPLNTILSCLCILINDLIIAYLLRGSFLSAVLILVSCALIFINIIVMIISICILINKKIKNTEPDNNRLKRVANWLIGQ